MPGMMAGVMPGMPGVIPVVMPGTMPGVMPGAMPERMEPAAMKAKLDEWVEAKRNRDFTLSDRLREELLAAGVKVDEALPDGVCRDFKRGACSRGEACKSSHGDAGPPG